MNFVASPRMIPCRNCLSDEEIRGYQSGDFWLMPVKHEVLPGLTMCVNCLASEKYHMNVKHLHRMGYSLYYERQMLPVHFSDEYLAAASRITPRPVYGSPTHFAILFNLFPVFRRSPLDSAKQVQLPKSDMPQFHWFCMMSRRRINADKFVFGELLLCKIAVFVRIIGIEMPVDTPVKKSVRKPDPEDSYPCPGRFDSLEETSGGPRRCHWREQELAECAYEWTFYEDCGYSEVEDRVRRAVAGRRAKAAKRASAKRKQPRAAAAARA